MKFSTQHYPMNISVEFEDGHDSSRIYWFSAGTTVIFYSFLCKYWPMPIFSN